MSVVLIKALQLILCLSLLVILHEGGHFMFAKLFGVKVEKFYLFFNPKFHLFSTRDKWFTRLFPRFKDNETEYGIGWIPLGGYVKIAGMVDESMDTEQLKQPAQPNEFRVQKVWKRFFIMFGGVLMNFLTAWALYSAILFFCGKDYIPMENVKEGFEYNEYAQEIGFQNGDVPVAIDGDSLKVYNPERILRALEKADTVTVLRQGNEVKIALPDDVSFLTLAKMETPFLDFLAKAEIDSVEAGKPAAEAGIQRGSLIVGANGHKIESLRDFDREVTQRRHDVLSAKGCTQADSIKWRGVDLVCQRADGTTLDTVHVTTDENYFMGIHFKNTLIEKAHMTYSFLAAIPAGLVMGWDKMATYVSDLRYVATKEGANSVGSFVTIGSIFPSAWDWQAFWLMTAFISIILAVMNLLPIPGLDGGHIAILLYEAITGHEPSEKFMIWAERVGIGILVLLMLLAMKNDIVNFIL